MSPASRWLLATLFLLAASATPQRPNADQYRDHLYNACRPMLLLVEFHSRRRPPARNTEEAISLNKKLSETREETLRIVSLKRLRIARLYTEDREDSNGATLGILVEEDHDESRMLQFMFVKTITDEFGKSYGAAVWEEHLYFPSDAGSFVYERMASAMLDDFLEAYLAINEAACD